MGKRSDFPRIDKDFYRTIDPRAVAALAPYLEPKTRFCEPCAGAGDLIDQLEAIGHRCVDAWDFYPQRDDIQDRDARHSHADGIDRYITNPPWSIPLLHELIEWLSAQQPTWLLFYADWAHTKQAEPYLKYCRKIVSVGRLKWIPGTTMSGKDNCAWYLFDQNAEGQTEFFGRAA
ncbi:hypothetical protein IWQ49_006398 [Labrenzia sp. EL_126]|nr:hypothetical protein [Labrenzia sp. EL_126]